MKKLTTILTLCLLVIVFSSAIQKVQKSAGPPSCHAGEPPNRTTCLECHNDGTLNAGSAQLFFDLGGADTNYVPGKIYTITISMLKAGMKRAGFQCIALRDDNDKISPGKVTITDQRRTQLLDKNAPHSGGCLDEERTWIEHTYDGNSSNDTGLSTWSYQWQAPDLGSGSITFYLAALEANNDLAETGDQVYAVKKTITGLPSGIHENSLTNDYKIYPVPADQELHIRYKNEKPEEVALYTLTGNRVKVWSPAPAAQNNTLLVDVGDVNPGVYLVEITTRSNERLLKKVVIGRK